MSEPQTPHIVVPTTAGTGSEVTIAAVITNKTAGRKLFIADPRITPNAAILDPRFTMTLPKNMTVGSAMDALTHAVEASMSIMANPICDGQALHAIRLISENLPLVVADGNNEKARLNMQIAATMAGWSFTIAQVGLAHCMAHTVGTLHHVPHGAACGIVLPKVMRFNVDHAAPKLARVAQALGVDTSGMTERDAALAAADAVEALMEKVGASDEAARRRRSRSRPRQVLAPRDRRLERHIQRPSCQRPHAGLRCLSAGVLEGSQRMSLVTLEPGVASGHQVVACGGGRPRAASHRDNVQRVLRPVLRARRR